MTNLLTNNKPFYIAATVYILLAALLLTVLPVGGIELSVYPRHVPVLNYFFLAMTFLGDGLSLLIVLPLIWYFSSWRTMVVVGLSVLATFAVVQSLKLYAFPDADRPLRFFGEQVQQYVFSGMEQNMHNSFPSGHSGQSMAIAASLSFFIRDKRFQYLLLATSILVGWSRVYLMQHFLLDTLVGAFFGLVMALLVFYGVSKSKLLKEDFKS